MLDDHGYGLSRRRVTVSTSGVVPMIDRLRDDCPVALAVSLHAPDDALRDDLVPLNRKYPIAELLAACTRYLDARAARLHHLRVLHARRRQRPAGAGARAARAGARRRQRGSGLACKFNLIPVQPVPGLGPACARRASAWRPSPPCCRRPASSPPCARRAATTSTPPAASSPARCRTAPASPSAACAPRRCGSIARRRPASREPASRAGAVRSVVMTRRRRACVALRCWR